ncbi:MAG: DUF2934 domain-containing protein [Candidatus Eisenbacteria bacterium]
MMEIIRDNLATPAHATAEPDPIEKHTPDEEAAARTRQLYAQYSESVREAGGAATAPTRRRGTGRPSRGRRSGTHGPRPLTHETIAKRAFELYAASGYPHGRDVEFWLEAERELRGELEA